MNLKTLGLEDSRTRVDLFYHSSLTVMDQSLFLTGLPSSSDVSRDENKTVSLGTIH